MLARVASVAFKFIMAWYVLVLVSILLYSFLGIMFLELCVGTIALPIILTHVYLWMDPEIFQDDVSAEYDVPNFTHTVLPLQNRYDVSAGIGIIAAHTVVAIAASFLYLEIKKNGA